MSLGLSLLPFSLSLSFLKTWEIHMQSYSYWSGTVLNTSLASLCALPV